MKSAKTLALFALLIATAIVAYVNFRPTFRQLAISDDAEEAEILRAFELRLESDQNPDLKIGNSTVIIDEKKGCVLRKGSNGEMEWSTQLGESLPIEHWSMMKFDGVRIFIRQSEWVAALDSANGMVLWQKKLPSECFCLSSDRLVLVRGRQVVALDIDTGIELFQLSLPAAEDFWPRSIEEVAGLFLVQRTEDPGHKGDSFLIDRTGKIRHRFPQQIVASQSIGPDLILLTSTDVRRVAPDGSTSWRLPFKESQWLAGGKIVQLENDEFVAYLYCQHANSGVELLRFNATRGEQRWQVWTHGLPNVAHSEYYHDATVKSIGDRLCIISKGGCGIYIEWCDSRTGSQMRRRERRENGC